MSRSRMEFAPFPTNLGNILGWRPGRTPGRVLVDLRAGGRRWTYSELDRAADGIAAGLRSRGCRSGEAIAILGDNSAEFLISYLGIMRAGLVAVPINGRLPPAMIADIVADCAARLLFVDSHNAALAPSTADHVLMDGTGEDALSSLIQGQDSPRFEPDEEALAEILYTSGSTGTPKGVMLTHHGQLQALRVHLGALSTDQEWALVAAPLYHMNGLFSVSLALLQETNLVLMPRFRPRPWLRAIARYGCTRLGGVPTMFAMALRERDLLEKLDFSHVETVLIGSAPMTARLFDSVRRLFPNAQARNGYGTTEAGPSIFGDHPRGLERPPLSVGYPLPTAKCRLVQRTAAGEGILEVRTPAMFKGYLNQPEETRSRLAGGWYRTGDVFRRDREGFYHFVRRADDMFVCGGENIYPAAIEMLLARHPGVDQVAVVPIPDDMKGEVPVAFVVPDIDQRPDPRALKEFALENGPRFSHPRAFLLVDKLPMGGTHKIDRAALSALAASLVRRKVAG